MAVPRRLFDEFGSWDETIGLQGHEKVKGEDSGFFEDTEFQDRIRKAGGSVWFCPTAVVHHRVDRRTVTPRRVASTAFSRGRNDVWTQSLPVWQGFHLAPRRNALTSLFALAGSLFRWALWVLLFRASGRKRWVEGARRAAYAAGGSLDGLRAGRSSMRLYHGAARIVFPVRSLLLRLTPDVP